MAIPREYATSNPQVRDALAMIPLPAGVRIGDFVAPDYPVEAEVVDSVVVGEHKLDLDDLRAPDAEAKSVRFETGSSSTISIVERALKTTMDSRKIEEAGARGVDLIAQRLDMLRADIMDAKEYRIAQAVLAAASYGATHKVAATNFRTADLYSTFEAAQEVIVADGNYPAEYALFGRTAWKHMRTNAEFNKFVAGPTIKSGARDLTLERAAEYLGLKEVRVGDFRRNIGGTVTQFWTTDSVLLFSRQATVSTRTLAVTPVCPYGQYQNVAEGTLVDARTSKLSGTDELLEVGAYHRYISLLRNANLGFLWTGVVGV
ncbi:MAG: major capsid protein [Thermoanaerobaculia bacterium]